MNSPAIRVENLSKQYQIGARQNGHTTFRETLAGLLTNPFRRFKSLSGQISDGESFWALEDVSFDVQPGEVVGIIGRNGAGKSTLLKVLSQITEPTGGRVEINGRVASLLEVGTGFHAELTGRENIYLNGSILGMTRTEVRRKFDAIVAFADIDHFLDTPVKRYSSGMYVRLAFAVAAHLDPEILIVDEVLAVGDAAFQKKCLGKMGDAAKGGRTVLLVSHQLDMIAHLCPRSILLNSGHIEANDATCTIIDRYRRELSVSIRLPLGQRLDRQGTASVSLTDITIDNPDNPGAPLCSFGSLRLRAGYVFNGRQRSRMASFAFAFRDALARPVTVLNTRFSSTPLQLRESGTVECVVPRVPLAAGVYQVDAYCYEGGASNDPRSALADMVETATEFTIVDLGVFPDGQRQDARLAGCLVMEQSWDSN